MKELYFHYMREALIEAGISASEGNVPVGALVVCNGDIIGRGHNQKSNDPTGHAEIMAIRDACSKRNHWKLQGCTIYVTLEPCPMCAGAIVLARLDKVVYGASDPKAGSCGTLYDIPGDTRLNHRCSVIKGILAQESIVMLREYFLKRRS